MQEPPTHSYTSVHTPMPCTRHVGISSHLVTDHLEMILSRGVPGEGTVVFGATGCLRAEARVIGFIKPDEGHLA